MTLSKTPEIRVSQFNCEAKELTPEEAFTRCINPKENICENTQSIDNIILN